MVQMRADVTASMAGYAKGMARAAQAAAYADALAAEDALARAEAGGWQDGPTGEALAAADAADASLGRAIDAGQYAWQADRMVNGSAPARQAETVPLPEYEAEAS